MAVSLSGWRVRAIWSLRDKLGGVERTENGVDTPSHLLHGTPDP